MNDEKLTRGECGMSSSEVQTMPKTNKQCNKPPRKYGGFSRRQRLLLSTDWIITYLQAELVNVSPQEKVEADSKHPKEDGLLHVDLE